MTTFDEREQAFENKFKHDQELLFRIRARRAKLLGLWAADLLGLKGAEAQAYAMQAVDTDLEHVGSTELIDKIHRDLEQRGLDYSRHRVEREANELLENARAMITKS